MSLPPITGALTTAFAAVAALTTVIAFAAIGSTGSTVVPPPNPNAPRLWRPRAPPVANRSVKREVAPPSATETTTRECFLVEPLAADGVPVVRVLGLPLGLACVPVTAASPSIAQNAAPSCEAQRSERECQQPCRSKAAPAID